MSKHDTTIEHKYTMSSDERTLMQDIEVGLLAFNQAVSGMQTNKMMLEQRIIRRLGIAEKDGYAMQVGYKVNTGEVFVTYVPQEEEKAKIILAKN